MSYHEKMQSNFQCIILSERSQYEKATYCMIPITYHSGKGQTLETVKKISGCQGLGRGLGKDEAGENRKTILYDITGYMSLCIF